MPQDVSQDIAALREWLAKESYLPQDFDDLMLKKFLHSCYGSLEKTKRCIEKFSLGRARMLEVYDDRDPLLPALQTAMSITEVTTYLTEEDEVLIHRLDDPELEKFVFYDVLKTFTLQGEHWLRKIPHYPRGHIIVLDVKCFSLKIVPKCNILFFRDFLAFLLEAMPVRITQIHVVNCPSFIDKLYALVKSALPIEVRNLVKFHTDAEGLHQHINKKYLPKEYGGDAESMADQQKKWVKVVTDHRDWWISKDSWKVDMIKKPKDCTVQNTMNGSFRTLSID